MGLLKLTGLFPEHTGRSGLRLPGCCENVMPTGVMKTRRRPSRSMTSRKFRTIETRSRMLTTLTYLSAAIGSVDTYFVTAPDRKVFGSRLQTVTPVLWQSLRAYRMPKTTSSISYVGLARELKKCEVWFLPVGPPSSWTTVKVMTLTKIRIMNRLLRNSMTG